MASLQSALGSCSRCVSGSRTSFNLNSLRASLPSTSTSFSTSSAVSESRKTRTARLKRKNNLDQRIIKSRMLESSKPDPVLGHQPFTSSVWASCELAKLVLEKEQVWGVKEDRRGNLVSTSQQSDERRLNFGLEDNPAAKQLLFKDLPDVMSKDRILDSWNLGVMMKAMPNSADVAAFEEEYNRVVSEEQGNATMLERVLDLRNASGKGIQVENIRRIVSHFGKGVDTGSPEVQAAVLTYRIRNLASHLESARHDNSNRRAMTMLVHQRAKILKYLKRKSPTRYNAILPRIGVEARAVEGEVIVPGKPKVARM